MTRTYQNRMETFGEIARHLVNQYPALVIAGFVGITLFLLLFSPVFMGSTRPLPLSRDEITMAAREFATLEGWASDSTLSWTVPVEGGEWEFAELENVDRSALPDPQWETWIISNPDTFVDLVTSGNRPPPWLSLALTPDGRVVQYLEASSPIAAMSIAAANEAGVVAQRDVPLREFDTRQIFSVDEQQTRNPTGEERARVLALADAFFERHGMPNPGPPMSLRMSYDETKESTEDAQSSKAYVTWLRDAGGFEESIRLLVFKGRVAAFDLDVAGEPTPPAATTWTSVMQILSAVPILVYLIGAAFVAVLFVIKRRQGEIDLFSTATIFVAYLALSFLATSSSFGLFGAMFSHLAGYEHIWIAPINLFVSVPIVSVLMALVTAGAWAVSEGQAYLTWPQHRIRPFSALVRGRFRSREAAVPVAIGYLIAFAALGAATLVGMVSPRSSTPSIAPLFALYSWPVFVSPIIQAFASAFVPTILAGMLAMTYTRTKTKRMWLVLAVGTIVGLVVRPLFTVQILLPVDAVVATVVMSLAMVGVMMIFVKYGPLTMFTTIFVYVSFMMAFPLVLTSNPAHAASGAWAMAFGLLPAAIAAYGVWRPGHPRATSVPTHVKRALDRLRINEEFEVARQVQARLLPRVPPLVPGLDIAGVCVPANEVGGDYYDYFDVGGGNVGIAVGDVSGKGVGAAIYMTLTKSYMVTQASSSTHPTHLLSRVNTHLRRNLARGTFVTMAYTNIDTRNWRLVYSRAGHNPPLLIRASGEGDFLNAPGIALGAAGTTVFESTTRDESVDLFPGDLLLLYTDGVTEAMNLRGEEYDEDRLIERAVAIARSGVSAAQAIDMILHDVREFAGRAAQHDDITLVAVRVLGPVSNSEGAVVEP